MTSPQPRRDRPWVAIIAVGAALVMVLIVVANLIYAATDDDEPEARPTPSAPTVIEPPEDGPPAKVELRPVLEVLGQNADCRQPGVWCAEDGSGGAYRLGPAELRTKHIVSAHARLSDYGSFVVGIKLSAAGAAKFERITAELAEKTGVRSQLAVVVDDVVISAPEVQGPVPGGEIDISGDFTQAKAEELAAAIDP